MYPVEYELPQCLFKILNQRQFDETLGLDRASFAVTLRCQRPLCADIDEHVSFAKRNHERVMPDYPNLLVQCMNKLS